MSEYVIHIVISPIIQELKLIMNQNNILCN